MQGFFALNCSGLLYLQAAYLEDCALSRGGGDLEVQADPKIKFIGSASVAQAL